MKKRIPLILLAAWTVLFMVLTLQNGIDTTNTSKGLTGFLISFFGLHSDPEVLHGMLRHAAHIIFLAGEGVILFIVLHAARLKPGKNILLTGIVCLALAFLTEAVKIGIVGRAFQLDGCRAESDRRRGRYCDWADFGCEQAGARSG